VHEPTKASFRPSRRRGQNFLVDRGVQRRIAASAALPPGTTVVEIGAGTGNLTDALIARGLKVFAIEVDNFLLSELQKRFAGHEHVKIISGDARKMNMTKIAGGSFHVIANLPYSVGTRLIIDLLRAEQPPRSLTVLLQKEVAEKLIAEPGRMGLLSVIVQSHAEVRHLFDVSPDAFRPRPKVMSSLVRIQPLDPDALCGSDLQSRIAIARHGFSQTRKKLRNSLAAGLRCSESEIEQVMLETSIDPSRRPQTITLKEWDALAEAVRTTRGRDLR
tara:strand:- start:4370 stop:5194 length:825 start_codon:yes stop_codon:yes gene_type:complete